jgi:hypothetical protein
MSKQTLIAKLLTKDEALVLLSEQLRNPKLEADLFTKVMSLYSKISGWAKEKDPEPTGPNLDELVASLEKKWKQHA